MTNNLKVLRAMKNISQEELAKQIEVSRQTINAMEKGKYVPSTLLALKLSRYFERPVEEIFTLEESIKHFNLEGIGKSPSKLDMSRILSMNEHYIKSIDEKDLYDQFMNYCKLFKNEIKFKKSNNPEGPLYVVSKKEIHKIIFSNKTETDVKMKIIHGSGKKGLTDFIMLFPSLRTQRNLMIDLTKRLTEKNHKTMVFSNSHRNSELLAIQAKKQKVNIKVHRAGLMANYRKSVEQEFKDDRLQAISCTPTLELGIDVGNVDCVISSTIPVNGAVTFVLAN